ncbi:PQQ-binding-like beta-propeller repeat protein [Trujillonella endophytica]|uniref:Outer membrane protein assembly factor BamB, contains PQQ-like beta-propeller repeat n=1 Tax=Trujillonella endophytica TaxID=673521 RepID=A0A1H8RZX3_9ACTN|nr:PQQ-binding-like beta-propeller repeat protein [Trujillella endophytica]SEO71826.1 Outer membrane protein assembly factor BamB, contains PQQ-like beta-propeller repeat [Trujillella endophytica]
MGPAFPARLRRPPLRVWVWLAAALALVVTAALLWRGSDAAATESTTAPAADVPEGAPAAAVSRIWTADGGPVPALPVQDGRVLVGEEHGVRAFDAVTGEEAWHYTRSNARLCDLTAVDGRAVAVFATADRCDEAVALDAGTGVRQWTRNLSLRPDVTLTSSPGMVLATAPTGVVVVDPGSDTLRWRADASDGCRIDDGDVGGTAVVLLESCDGTLRLRGLGRGDGEDSWSQDLVLPDPAVPVALAGSDRLVAVVAGDALQLFRATDGSPLPAVGLPPAGPDDPPPAVVESAGALFVWTRGTTYALDQAAGRLLWSVPSAGLPAAGNEKALEVLGPPVLVPEDGAFVSRDARTGAEIGRSTVDDELPAGGSTATVGPVVVYRLADRVLAHR